MTAATAMTAPSRKAPREPRNGVDTPALMTTIGVVAEQPALAAFRFRGDGRWMAGTHSRTTFRGFHGAGGEHEHKHETTASGDHPAVLCGADEGPTPVEWLLHALSSCIMAGIANIAAARGVTLYEVTSRLEGDIDLRGILGLSDEVRNGYGGVRAVFTVKGDAPAEKLEEIVRQAQARSAVFDVMTNGVPVSIAAETAGTR
jgi:uncharacterized OsmC-like protein